MPDKECVEPIKAIGISNFYADRMVEFCRFACNDFVNADGDLIQGVRPMVNQVEIHPYHQQNTLLEWMRQYDIQPEAWAPLGEEKEEPISKTCRRRSRC